MLPVLFELRIFGGRVSVTSYTFFLTLAAVVLVAIGALVASRRGLDARRSALCLAAGFVATSIGARLAHWLTNPDSFERGLRSIVAPDRSNLSGYAGLLLGVPAAAAAARRLGVDAWRLADSAVPAVALAAVLAKVGCFLNGCCFGGPAEVPWAVCPSGPDVRLAQIAAGSIGIFDAPLPVHPAQLYEALAALTGGLVSFWLLRANARAGAAFLAFAVWFTSFRLLSHLFLRAPLSSAAPGWLYPALYAAVIVACAGRLIAAAKSAA